MKNFEQQPKEKFVVPEKFEGKEIEEKEKTPEEILLDEKRGAYAGAYTEYRFRGFKKKELAKFEKDIELARKFIKVGDSNRLKVLKGEEFDKFDKALPEERERYFKERDKARDRRNDFIKELIERGIRGSRAEAIYNVELSKLEYDNEKLNFGKKMKEEVIADAKIFKKLILDEKELLNNAKVESWPPKEKNLFRKGMEGWMKLPRAVRITSSVLLTTGALYGLGAVGVTLFGAKALAGASMTKLAIFGGKRFYRAFAGAIVGQVAAKGVEKVFFGNLEKIKEENLKKLEQEFSAIEWTSEKLKEFEKKRDEIFETHHKKERNKNLVKAATAIVAGAGTAVGLGFLEQAYAGGVKVAPHEVSKPTAPEASPEAPSETPAETHPEISPEPEPIVPPEAIKPEVAIEVPTEIKPEILTIGERGPEGAIIDYFKNNLDIAKKFGWDGEVDLDKWTGTKAHQLWLEDAKEALEKPEILDKLEKLGYSRDIEGYAQMMRRIGEGGVEINPEIGKIELVDTEYLKARISAETPSPEAPSLEAPSLEAPAKHIPEKLGDFENYNLLEQDRTLNLLDNNINDIKNNLSKFTDPDSIGKIKGEISRLEDLKGSMLKNPAFLENQTTMRTYLIFLERETGLNLDEYSAIKNVKAGKFLEEISRYKESGEWPDLPSHGSYGAMELKRQVGLAQILDSDQWKGIDKDLTIEDAIKSKIMTVAETGVGQTGKTLDSSVFEQVGGKTLVEAGILDNIIQDKFISDAEINQVWNNLKSNKLTPDDFISYYSYKLNESGIKFENDSVLRKGFKEVFNNYIKETDPALKAKIEIGKIKPALKVLLNRLAKQ